MEINNYKPLKIKIMLTINDKTTIIIALATLCICFFISTVFYWYQYFKSLKQSDTDTGIIAKGMLRQTEQGIEIELLRDKIKLLNKRIKENEPLRDKNGRFVKKNSVGVVAQKWESLTNNYKLFPKGQIFDVAKGCLTGSNLITLIGTDVGKYLCHKSHFKPVK